MKLRTSHKVLAGLFLVLAPVVGIAAVGCLPTSHAVVPAGLGQTRAAADLEALTDKPGAVTVETVTAADWEVDRSGVLNLDHPKAKAAGLTDGPEPIQIFFHAVRHPSRGLFLVDTGCQRAFITDPENAALRGIVASAAGADKITMKIDTATWLSRQPEPPAGVFLTHLHLDHILGLPDVPKGTPIFMGPGETADRDAMNVLIQGTADRALEGHAPLRELRFDPDPTGTFAGILDLFGDGSVFALSVPGHTSGSTAFLARTPKGPVLMVGDASHTAFGWENGVDPGSFTRDHDRGAESLQKLRAFAARHPGIDVRLGHQHLPEKASEGVAQKP